MENKKVDWDVKPKLKEVKFYKEPKPGCPKFIKKDPKCQPKDLPKWGLDTKH